MRYFVSIFLASMVMAYSPQVFPCLHAGKPIVVEVKKSTKVRQAAQQALILHHKGVEDLFLKVDYRGDSVSELGWIIPVPAAPDKYALADNRLFSELRRWTKLKRHTVQKILAKGRGGGGGRITKRSKSPLRLLANTTVGPFQIQPIQAQGPAAVDALNGWMKKNRFETFKPEQLSYYIDRKWTFLAVRIAPKKGEKLGDSGSLPPLRITFATERAVYPLKFSTHMGGFSAQVTLITADTLSKEAFNGARAKGFEVVHAGRHLQSFLSNTNRLSARSKFKVNQAPKSLRGPLKVRFQALEQLHASVLYNPKVNGGRRKSPSKKYGVRSDSPMDWAEDLSIPGLPSGERLMGRIEVEPVTEPASKPKALESESKEKDAASTTSASAPKASAKEEPSSPVVDARPVAPKKVASDASSDASSDAGEEPTNVGDLFRFGTVGLIIIFLGLGLLIARRRNAM